uniref:N-acetyltransferase 9-like protein n=1 Tax=Polytomella parva TaxID=51329 RepID=A0A7S0YEB4_9CHLO|mmetsp:Transcript_13463/g.23825  ORF Transcript_13463/g.23825 Transcript_13463/m.23825 type:complete len:204 (+) Transcript_13463:41-652(+)
MIINSNTVLVGERVVLVPYKKEHVEKYHEWMKDPILQQTTASEPLTIEEEFEMQKSWLIDDNKLTFIILEKNLLSGEQKSYSQELQAMVGDVNLFINDPEEPEGEIEIMIAESNSRRKGIASEALNIFMSYCQNNLKLEKFVAKIGKENVSSQKLFEKLGYKFTKEVRVFNELHFECEIRGISDKLRALQDNTLVQKYESDFE